MTSSTAVSIYEVLLNVCVNNKIYFENYKDEKSRRLSAGFIALEEQIENLLPLLNEFRDAAPSYDFRCVPANGYRSYIIAADRFSNICLKISQTVRMNRTSLFFQKAHYIKEIESCVQVYSSLNACFQLLQILRSNAEPEKLFLEKIDKLDDIEKCIDKVNIKSFYGRFIGFHYGESTQLFVKTVAIMMSAFAEYYYNEKNVIQCAAMCSQFYANPELRADRMAKVTSYRSTQVKFCKHFWNISEHDIAKKLNVLMQPSHAINEKIELPPEPIQYLNGDHTLDIPVPVAYLGPKILNVRLISSVKREGMEYFKRINDSKGQSKPPSDWFIFHLHGGGFVSLTSESHQLFLKNWSIWTNGTPILSVDYSLAPEAPYPRAVEEILYAYVWALNNVKHLGSTAKRIVFAGDSAGANLCLGLILKCIDLNIRKPDGLFLAYGPTVLQFYPCPSRFLGFMDPLLSFGFMMCAIKAYVHVKNDWSSLSSPTESQSKSGISSSSEDSLGNNFTETEPFESLDGDLSNATFNTSSSSFPELLEDFDENLISSDKINDAQVDNERSLPSKYKKIIKGFMTNLKNKFNSNLHENHSRANNSTPDLADVANIAQLVNEVQDTIYLSPVKAGAVYFREFPPTSIFTVEMDPCLDDSVTLAKKLDKLGKHVYLDVLSNLCHGFLNISLSSKEAYNGSMLCARRIKELLEGNLPSHSN